MQLIKNIITIFLLLFLQLSSAGQSKNAGRHGFCILAGDETGKINYYDKRYSVENNFFYPLSVLDSVATGITPNGYPSLLLFFKKNETSYRLLNNAQKQLAWFDNDSMLVCARLLSFDSSYSMQLAGNFTMQEISRLKDIAMVGMGKQLILAHSEPALESTTKIDPAIVNKALFEWEQMAKVFLQALQKRNYRMLDSYALDSLQRQKLIRKLTLAWNTDMATSQVNKNTKAAQDDFDKLLQDNTITWADVKYEHAEIENFEYYPTLDIYIGNLTLWAGIKGHKLHISFDECLYFDNRWWMVCGYIRLVE